MIDDKTLKAIEAYFSFHALFDIGIIANKPLKKKAEKQVLKKEIMQKLNLPSNLKELEDEVRNFEGCKLKRFAQNTVFGEGIANPKYMIIGEAPGEEEDINGVPFCGRSGKLLEIILRKFGIKREENAYITNSVFWRPPGNRKPEKEELSSCRPFLEKMIKILKPEVIIAIGSISLQNAVLIEKSISEMRKKEFSWQFLHENQEEIKVITLYHPSYLLRSPIKKRDVYLDILHFKKRGLI
jgi:uracil-DNA glycosylase family 4